eukprot:9173655-Pyramimonas_sp.AAC.1
MQFDAVMCAPLYHAMLRVAMNCDVMLHCAMPRHAMICYAMPCFSASIHRALWDHCPIQHPTVRE